MIKYSDSYYFQKVKDSEAIEYALDVDDTSYYNSEEEDYYPEYDMNEKNPKILEEAKRQKEKQKIYSLTFKNIIGILDVMCLRGLTNNKGRGQLNS